MSEEFDRLTDQEKHRIIALPYRVGLWMSTLDGGGGDVADELESMAMIHAIEHLARAQQDDFAAYICRQTLAARADWLKWSANFTVVPDECTQAISDLAPFLSRADLDGYKGAVFSVATAVARAYREGVPRNRLNNTSLITQMLNHIHDNGAQGDQTVNVSPHERAALDRLAAALEYTPVSEQV